MTRKSDSKSDNPKEDTEQAIFVMWLKLNNIPFYAIPNGGFRNKFEAFKLKRTGVRSGVPDICIPKPSGLFHGAYIEMKRKIGGKLSNSQLYWLDLLRGNGYYAEVAHGFPMARELIEHYLSLTQKDMM